MSSGTTTALPPVGNHDQVNNQVTHVARFACLLTGVAASLLHATLHKVSSQPLLPRQQQLYGPWPDDEAFVIVLLSCSLFSSFGSLLLTTYMGTVWPKLEEMGRASTELRRKVLRDIPVFVSIVFLLCSLVTLSTSLLHLLDRLFPFVALVLGVSSSGFLLLLIAAIAFARYGFFWRRRPHSNPIDTQHPKWQ